MRVGVNLLPYDAGKHGGAEVYLRNIVEWMVRLRPDWKFVLFGRRTTVDAYRDISSSCEFRYLSLPRCRAGRVLVEQLRLPVEAMRARIDCLISNYVAPVAFGRRNLTIIHDMLLMRYPNSMERSKVLYWKALLPLSARVSGRIGTVSQFSEREILRFIPTVAGRTFVTVEGVRRVFEERYEHPSIRGAAPRYLIVATFGSHKNLLTAVRAFAEVRARHASAMLTIVGAARTPDAIAYQAAVQQEVSRLGVADAVRVVGHISDTDLARMYVESDACVVPSLYEGFGLPIVEAQRLRCPVIVADAGSLPEVAGEGAIRVPALDVPAFASAMISILDQEKARRLREAGVMNAEKFQWELAARQMIVAIETGFSRR